jgi:integrase
MSVTIRVLAPAVNGERRCHFLVQWRDSHAIQHGRTFATWQEAAEFDAAIKAGKLPRDAPGHRAAVTFGTAAARWLATKQATKRPSTADLYATELRSYVLPAFASMPLPDITRRDVQEWVNALAASGLAPATVRHAYRAVFKSVLNDAIDDGLLARSPCHCIELPAAAVPVIEPLTPAQIRTLADRIDPRYRAMVLLAAGCGLRWSEAAGLTRDRIHLGARAQVTIDRQLGYRPATKRHGYEAAARPLFAPPKTSASCRIIPLPRHRDRRAARRPARLPARPGRATVHHPRRERAQPRELAAADLAAPDPVRSRHPSWHHLPPAPPRLRLAARTPACPTTTSSSASATPTPARSAGTAIPIPTQETARPPATPSTPPSPEPEPAARRQQRVDFADGKVDQLRAAQRAARTFSQVTRHVWVRSSRLGLSCGKRP